MKQNYGFWILLALLLTLAFMYPVPQELTAEERCNMPIEFTGVNDQVVLFDPVSFPTGAFTNSVWIYPHRLDNGSGLNSSLLGPMQITPAGKLSIQVSFTGVNGLWVTTNAIFSINTVYHVSISYSGVTAEDPVFYVDGVSVAVTEDRTPTGDISNSATAFRLGNSATGNADYDGTMSDARRYNRVFSASEAAEIHSARGADGNGYGLIWQCKGIGAAGLQAYDGATLLAANTFTDWIGGTIGVPSGSPTGRGDAYLSFP